MGLLLLLLLVSLLLSGSSLADSRGIKAVSRKIPEKPQERVAVVIGNGKYRSSPLKNPVNDARAMADLLEKLKFRVDLVVNGDRRKMLRTLSQFSRRLRKADVGLFYYAGHGIQVKGRNYLVPVDAILETESDVEFEALDLGRVLGKMDDAGCPLNIVILDACRDNPFSRSFRSAGKGLAMVDAPRGTLLAFATAPGSVAADGNGRNGIYTRNLLANMNQPGLSIEEVFKRVRIGVVEETNGRQTPWESSSLMGDFYFIPDTAPKKAPAPGQKTEASLRKAPEEAAPSPAPKVKPGKTTTSKTTRKPAKSNKKPVQTASLQKTAPAKPAVKKHSLSPEIRKYLRMIHSGNSRQQRDAAKRIFRARLHRRVLLDALQQELLKGYNRNPQNRHHVDAMAWFCKVLGSSGNHRYASALNRVAGSSSSRKLRKYAAKSLKMLR